MDAISPEQVKTIEFGVRSNIKKSIYVDFNYYYSWYRDFIGYLNGISGSLDYATDTNGDTLNKEFNNFQVYRIATNSREIITTQGACHF